MLLKRLIVCLDVRNGRVTKGVRFADNVDVGDPVALAEKYCAEGADELVFYDITASAENRPIDIAMVAAAARRVFIPFTVGGGLRQVADMRAAILAGADKVSLNSLAVEQPDILRQGALAFGRQCIVLGLDARRVGVSAAFPSGYEVVIKGGRQPVGWDAVEWARRATDLGAGEICLNAIDTDGVQNGYELDITRQIAEAVSVPLIASGGAGTVRHVADAFLQGRADAALVASMVHSGRFTCAGIKAELAAAGIPVRLAAPAVEPVASPAKARKAFFALDFDGVICDSAAETAASAWKAAEYFWPGCFPEPAPTEYIQAFRAARPYLETGYQAIPMMKMLRDGLPPETLAAGLDERVDAIMAELGQNKTSMVHAFGDTRDQWIKTDLDDWISWHGIYPGVLEAVKKVLAEGQDIRILTTKQERFVCAILAAHGVDFPADHIWGLGRQESKEDQLARLLADGDTDVYFIEDRLETLRRVEARDDLRAIRLYYADWGYGTPADLAAASSDDRVTVLSLDDFPKFLAGLA